MILRVTGKCETKFLGTLECSKRKNSRKIFHMNFSPNTQHSRRGIGAFYVTKRDLLSFNKS